MSALQRACDGLTLQGIRTRLHFACCQTCGIAAMAAGTDPGQIGFAFSHVQDTGNALQSGKLYMSFASTRVDDDDDDADIGTMVCEGLWDEGMEVTWNGSPTRRLLVTLAPEDKEYLQQLEDEDIEAGWEDSIRHHRLHRAFQDLRVALFRRKVARRRIGRALIGWSSRPGGALFMMAAGRWKRSIGA